MYEKARCDEQRAFCLSFRRKPESRFCMESPAAMPEKLIAASAPQAGYLSLLVQSKGNPKKARPGAAETPCASRPGRARAELAGRKQRAQLRHRLAKPPGRGCDARRWLRVSMSKP